MVYVVNELPDQTLESSVDQNGATQDTLNRSFIVYDTESEDNFDIDQVVGIAGLPQMNDDHPTITGIRVKKRSVSRMPEKNHSFRVQYTYERDTSVISDDPIEVSTSSEITGEFVEVWRVSPAYPYDTSFPGEQDIAGTPIDSAGTPTSTFRRQVSYEKSFETERVDLPYLFSFVGTRNATWWEGFGPGSLLYTGCSLSVKSGGMISRTDRFVYDHDYHLRQVVSEFDGDLNPKLNAAGNANTVKWVQPFPGKSNFYSLGIPT